MNRITNYVLRLTRKPSVEAKAARVFSRNSETAAGRRITDEYADFMAQQVQALNSYQMGNNIFPLQIERRNASYDILAEIVNKKI